jgi:hypothetical protein
MEASREELVDVLSKLGPFVGQGVLGGIRIYEDAVFASDLSYSIIVPYDFGFEASVDYKTLLNILKKTNESSLSIEKTKEGISIYGERFNAVLNEVSNDIFPERSEIDVTSMNGAVHDFQVGLSLVFDCASTDEYRYNMTGVYVDENVVVSTDGKQLALYDIQEDMGKMLIPKRFASILSGFPEIVQYEVKEKSAWFRTGDGILLGCRLMEMEAEFPAYQKIFENIGDFFQYPYVSIEENDLVGSGIVSLFEEDADTHSVFIVGKGSEGKVFIESENKVGNVSYLLFDKKKFDVPVKEETEEDSEDDVDIPVTDETEVGVRFVEFEDFRIKLNFKVFSKAFKGDSILFFMDGKIGLSIGAYKYVLMGIAQD